MGKYLNLLAGVLTEEIRKGSDVWEIHLGLFPVVQQVLNPPFINPHLPKMYRIYRQLLPYLEPDEIPQEYFHSTGLCP
jgi:hypothetical protein